jgi:ankyrin repeat protein
MRARLEICLGVVVSGAAMVALSTVLPPNPMMLHAGLSEVPSIVERRSEADLRAEPPPAPKVSTEFAKAVASGDLDTMNKLHTPGMALDGMLALAAESGDKAAVVWLLERGADVHEDEASQDAPVLLADAHPEVAALLLARGAAEPKLAIAAHVSAAGTVHRLLAAHVEVNPKDAWPLNEAVSSTRGTPESKQRIIGELLAGGAEPNPDGGDAPLTAAVRTCGGSDGAEAAEGECLALVRLLVKHGARTRGETLTAALALEDRARDASLAALLGARLEPGATAIALAQAPNVPPPIMKQLVAKGVDWAWRDGEDDAALPLLAGVQRGDRDYVRALLDAGAPVEVHFKDGTSALGAAIDGAAGGNADYARIVELLVARGANVNRRLPDGRTPLFAAAESGDLRVVTALLARGARVNDLVLDDTALDAAEQGSHQPVARLLHAHGARRARKDGAGHAEGL